MSTHIAIYGAAANTPSPLPLPLPWLSGLKRRLKTLRDLRRLRRSVDFRCDYRDYAVDYVSNIGDIAIAETVRRKIRQLIPACTFSNVDWGNVGQLQSLHATRKLDLLVIAGGGYFFLDKAGRIPKRLQADLDFLSTCDIPYVFWGVGVNHPFNPQCEKYPPATTESDKDILRGLLDGARMISVRDKYSVEYLASHTSKSVQLIGDPALHIVDTLAISANNSQLSGVPLIGLNFPFHGPCSNKFLLANLPAYARALKTIQQHSACRFRYITHHACEYVVPRLLREKGVELEIVHTDLAGTCNAYLDLDIHIGGMLHSCILSASAGTPWIAVAYDIKHHGFNHLMGMEEYYQDTLHFSETALIKLTLQALERKTELRSHISAQRKELHRSSSNITAAALTWLQ